MSRVRQPPSTEVTILPSEEEDDESPDRGDWWSKDPRRVSCLHQAACGASQAAMAQRLGVSRTTIRNWLNDSRFLARLENMQITDARQTQLKRMHHAASVTDYFQMKAHDLIAADVASREEAIKAGKKPHEAEVDNGAAVAATFKRYALARGEERKDSLTTEERLRRELLQRAATTDVTETRAVVLIRETLGDKRLREIAQITQTTRTKAALPDPEAEREALFLTLEATLEDDSVLSGFHQDHVELMSTERESRDE